MLSISRFAQQSNIILIHGILSQTDDFELRMHHRSQMDAAGLRNILAKCRAFSFQALDKQLDALDELFELDQQQLMAQFDQNILRDMTDPSDVFRTILASIKGTQAYEFFVSAMQHLLLIREEGEMRVRYYQLIDSLITQVVMDKKQSFSDGLSQTIGVSVARLVAQFGEHDRAQKAEQEATDARVQLGRVKLEKEALEEELSQAEQGLVGKLKERVAALEEKLRVSRQTTDALQGRLNDQKREYDDQIDQLEVQIMELFKMLREARSLDDVLGSGRSKDRKELISQISTQIERKKTIGILEGRKKRRGPGHIGDSDYDSDETGSDVESLPPLKSMQLGRTKGRSKGYSKTQNGDTVNGRSSQFMDADEERVRLHIEESLAAGAESVCLF